MWNKADTHTTSTSSSSSAWIVSSLVKVKYGFAEAGRNLYPVRTKKTYVAISRNISSNHSYWKGTVIYKREA